LGTNYDYVSQGLLLVYLNKVNTIYNITPDVSACQKLANVVGAGLC
jgi:hypothetical protein